MMRMRALTTFIMIMLVAVNMMPQPASSQAPTAMTTYLPLVRQANHNRIVFAVSGSTYGGSIPNAGELFTMNADGSQQVQLTHTDHVTESYPAWSPDGTHVAFIAQGPYTGISTAIGLVRVDGTQYMTTSLPLDPMTPFISAPAWSPVGTQFAFSTGSQMYVATVADSQLTLTHTATISNVSTSDPPAWSPDGEHLVFSTSHGIYLVQADNLAVQQLDPQSSGPQWSPDGQLLIFSTPTGIYTIHADGTEPKQLTKAGVSPQWSPDGRQIAFVNPPTWINARGDLYLMDADGSHVRLLVHEPAGGIVTPRWSPDGKRLAYGVLTSWVSFSLYTVGVDDGVPIVLIGKDASGHTRCAGGDTFAMSWSQDSKHIVVYLTIIHTSDMCVGAGDASPMMLIPVAGEDPQWSPD
jgi:Tol biopolymer transport system component